MVSHDQFLLLVQSVCYTSSYLVFFLLRFSCHWACKAQAMSLFGLHFESRTLKSSSNRIQLIVNCNPSASGIWKVGIFLMKHLDAKREELKKTRQYTQTKLSKC